MNVLSLFDGISCGQVALEKSGIKIKSYQASEIDKFAIKCTQTNRPKTTQLGDVRFVSNVEKYPDLIFAGSPCQGLSIAGKGLDLEDPRSKLFFEFVRIKNLYPSSLFLLENVKMRKYAQDIMSEYVGCEPIEINSSLVSAQNRKRLYWTNIPGVAQPEDKGYPMKGILQTNVGDSYFLNEEEFKRGIYSHSAKTWHTGNKMGKVKFPTDIEGKAKCLISTNITGNRAVNHIQDSACIQDGVATDIKGFDIIKRVYNTQGKSPTLTTMQGGHRQPKVSINLTDYRRLTPIECERLQGLPDNWTSMLSDSQRYKSIGNGWQVDTIVHILKGIS